MNSILSQKNPPIEDLLPSEIDLVGGGGLTAEEVVVAGGVAIRAGMTVVAVNPAAGFAIAAAGATAVLFGSFAIGIRR